MIVSNTTPIINFSSIERLDILKQLFGKISIPKAVYRELMQKRDRFPNIRQIDAYNIFKVTLINDIRLYNSFLDELDMGEAEAITLAVEKKAKLVLLDELAGRNVAQFLKLGYVGTIGILVQAKKNGIISNY